MAMDETTRQIYKRLLWPCGNCRYNPGEGCKICKQLEEPPPYNRIAQTIYKNLGAQLAANFLGFHK